MHDNPPAGVDEGVWRILRAAHAAGAAVSVWLRGDAWRGRAAREFTGCPMRFDLGSDGQVRVALGVAEGTEQHVVVARIARVMALARGDAGPPPADATAVVLGDEPRLRVVLTTALELDGWHVVHAPASDAATYSPALLVIAASPQRADATLAAVQALRRSGALATTPLLVAAVAPWDVAPGLRRMARARVLVAPFGLDEVRYALTELGSPAVLRTA